MCGLVRLVLSRFEVESVTIGEAPVETEEDEEEVWLFWKDSGKEIRSKSIRELAQDAKEGQREDQEVISYYRWAWSNTRAHTLLKHMNSGVNFGNTLQINNFMVIYM